MVAIQFVTATRAELVSSTHRPEAVSAACCELVIALRAEVEVTLHVSPTGGAFGDEGCAKEEVEYGADATGHNETDQHPEARTHGPAGCVLADVANHQDVEGSQESPRDVEVGAKAERGVVVLRFWEDDPEVVLDQNKNRRGDDDGPEGDQPGVFVRIDGFGFAHTLNSLAGEGFVVSDCRFYWIDERTAAEVALSIDRKRSGFAAEPARK